MGISIRAYARHRGITDAAVHKAIKTGRITKEPDGTINVERADAQWQANTISRRIDPVCTLTEINHTETISISDDEANEIRTILEENGHTVLNGKITYHDAKTANEILKAQIAQLELDIRKGNLLDRKKTCNQVFQLARQERDAWLNWPSRVACQMAAEKDDLNDPYCLQIILENYVHQHLSELSDVKLDVD